MKGNHFVDSLNDLECDLDLQAMQPEFKGFFYRPLLVTTQNQTSVKTSRVCETLKAPENGSFLKSVTLDLTLT